MFLFEGAEGAILFLYQSIALLALLALQHCLRFAFAYSIGIETE